MRVKLIIAPDQLRKLTAVAELAVLVMDLVPFAKDSGGLLYRYESGVYKPDGEKTVWKIVQWLLDQGGNSDKWSSHRSKEVAAYIRTKAPTLWEAPPPGSINVANGMVDLASHELRPHDPTYLSSIQLPVVYDGDCECPAIDRFLNDVLPSDTVSVAYEIAASLIVPCTGIQKAILLYGEGANGKSTYLDVLATLLGTANVSSISLQQLQERFYASTLVGKLANICPDLPTDKLRTVDRFKAITSGDLITVERKHEAPFTTRLLAKLIFSANHLPVAADRSQAYYRRWLIVPFPNTFTANPRIALRLKAELTSPKELSGFLNRALQVLPQVLSEGITESNSMKEVMREFRGGDQLEAWLIRETVMSPEAFVVMKMLWDAFDKDTGCGMTFQAFGRRLRQLRPNVGDAQRRVGGQVVWVYTGMELRSPRVCH